MEQQQLTTGAERNGAAVVDDLEGPEDAELHGVSTLLLVDAVGALFRGLAVDRRRLLDVAQADKTVVTVPGLRRCLVRMLDRARQSDA